MRALELLSSRKEKLNIHGELCRLPPHFKNYISLFNTGTEEIIFRSPFFRIGDNKENIQLRWENSKEKNPWLYKEDRLTYLLTEVELEEELKEFNQKSDTWHAQGLIKIGGTHGDVVLLGMNKNNQDQIFLYGESTLNDDFPKIADDIFDLFCQLELIDNVLGFVDFEIEKEQLYKNWNEDFWRIREGNT